MSFPTASDVEAGIEVYNRFLADVWSSKQGEFTARLAQSGRALVTREQRIRDLERLELDFASPPALRLEGAVGSAGRLRVILSAPGDGGWNLSVRARVKVGFPFSRRGSIVELDIERLRVEASLELDRHSPTAASFVDSRVNVALGDVDVRASNFILKIFSGLLSFLIEIFEKAIEDVARDALADSLPDPAAVKAITDLGLAAEPVPFAGPVPSLTDLEDQAREVSARIASRHTPFDTVLNTLVARDDPDGPARGYRQVEDSAIWSGHWIAGEVYRHRVSGDPQALDNLRKGLRGLAKLIALTDEPGLLSRVAVPVEETEIVEAVRQERIDAGHEERLFVSVDGKFQSIGHITRDQYAGAFLGAGLAALEVDEDDIRSQARDIVSKMASFLVERHFCPTEAVADPELGFKPTSVTYLLEPAQVLAILQLARRLDPDRYGEVWERFSPMGSILWIFEWLKSLDPHSSYYKFNLEHSLGLLLLDLEADPERRRWLALGLRTLRRPLRFHAQAWFNVVELAVLEDDELSRPRMEIETETRHLLQKAFERPALIDTVDLGTDPALDLVELGGLSKADAGKTETVARRPVDVVRRPGADFLWQRSPFSLRVVWQVPDDPAMRSPGIDLMLPYWLARRLGL